MLSSRRAFRAISVNRSLSKCRAMTVQARALHRFEASRCAKERQDRRFNLRGRQLPVPPGGQRLQRCAL